MMIRTIRIIITIIRRIKKRMMKVISTKSKEWKMNRNKNKDKDRKKKRDELNVKRLEEDNE